MTNISPWAVTALAVSTATAFSIALLLPSTIPTAHAFALRPPPSAKNSLPVPHPASASSSALGAKNRQGNPFQTLIGDMASSLFSSSSSSSTGPSNPKQLTTKLSTTLSTQTWNDITTTLQSKQTPTERSFRTNLSKGYGPPSPLHKIRLFDTSNSESSIRVTLYRDSASWCPYCQKVWTTLEEKRIPYRVEKINMRCYGDKPREFLRLQPNGNIPVAVIDGTIYNQSNDIMYALESLFPDHKRLSPEDDDDRRKAGELLRLERRIFGAWMYWLTGGGRSSKGEFVSTLEEVERELGRSKGGDFFLGKDVTLVDMMFVPFLERMCASLLFFKGYQIRVPPGQPTKYPAINKWFDAMEQLESYQLTKSDYYTHCWDLPPQLGGCTYEQGGEPYERAINGERSILDQTRGSWELPLEPHSGGIEPDWTWCGDEDAAKREAVDRLSANYENIVNFASRGAGRKGTPPVMAALSDPNAVSNTNVHDGVDAVLRVVSVAMLNGTEGEAEKTMVDVANLIVKEGGMEYADGVVSSLSYLRDRVGVPRDMRLPAARQLRAHLNWAAGKILDVQDAS